MVASKNTPTSAPTSAHSSAPTSSPKTYRNYVSVELNNQFYAAMAISAGFIFMVIFYAVHTANTRRKKSRPAKMTPPEQPKQPNEEVSTQNEPENVVVAIELPNDDVGTGNNNSQENVTVIKNI